MNENLKDILLNILYMLKKESNNEWDNAILSGYKYLEIDKRGSFGERVIKDVMTRKVRRLEYKDGDQGDWDIKINNKKFEVKTSSRDKSGKFQNEGLKENGDYDGVIFVGVEPDVINIKCVNKKDIPFDKLHSRGKRGTGVGYKWDFKKADMTEIQQADDIFHVINNTFFDGKLPS